MALISLHDEGPHNIWDRAAVIPNITAGYVVFPVSLRIRRKTFSQQSRRLAEVFQ